MTAKILATIFLIILTLGACAVVGFYSTPTEHGFTSMIGYFLVLVFSGIGLGKIVVFILKKIWRGG